MHILHLVKTSQTAIWVYDLMVAIKEIYPETTFSILLPEGGRYFEKYSTVCTNTYDFDFKLDKQIFKRGKILREIVKQEKPDIIHSWYTQTTLYARLFLYDFKIPRLFEVIGPLHLEFTLYRWFDILSARKLDFWKPTSLCTYNLYLKHGANKEKLFFNYIAVNLQENIDEVSQHPIVNLRQKYKIPDNEKIIGTASFMYPPKRFRKNGVKNHEMLLQVFEQMLKKRNDIYLVIGGSTLNEDKSYENKLKKLASRISEDKIIFTGWVENLGRLITEFDIFVFLSQSENLGGVYESLLYKVPTVASNRGGIPELVINGKTGFTSDLTSIEDIVDKIEKVLDNKNIQEQFKIEGFNRIFEVFDKEKSINNSYEIYKKLLNITEKI